MKKKLIFGALFVLLTGCGIPTSQTPTLPSNVSVITPSITNPSIVDSSDTNTSTSTIDISTNSPSNNQDSDSKTSEKPSLPLPSLPSVTPSISTSTSNTTSLITGFEDDLINNNQTIKNYYASIDFSKDGTALLSELQSLNSQKRTYTPGYGGLWNYYNKTDYDPKNPSQYIAFYRGTSASKGSMNKEHVWPNSHGGKLVEGDIHMTRPTLSSDNSSRGNSFYVEGKNHSTNGWDPYADGMTEYYRGISARIIFYCVVASPKLQLVDLDYHATSNKNRDNMMGKLSDLLKWNLVYGIDDTEIRRNDGAQDVQGNRNPFIDDRTLACKIWGDTNETTKSICAQYDPRAKKSKMTNEQIKIINDEQQDIKEIIYLSSEDILNKRK